MGPQLVRCGKHRRGVLRALHALLQWGRNLFVAESLQLGDYSIWHHHTFNGAATCSLRKDNIMPDCLLCNWTFNGAATCSLRKAGLSVRYQSSRRPFNGAATCSLRKVTPASFLYTGSANLQWGRNLFVAESRGGYADFDLFCAPSMGPQLVRCGKLLLWQLLLRGACLQWGRNLFVAESSKDTVDSFWIFLLQWGRNLFVAERAGRHHTPRVILRPSMGPQLVRCGKAYLRLRLQLLVVPSMGPQLVRCGKVGCSIA